MSFGTFWGTNPADPNTYEKILPRYLPPTTAVVDTVAVQAPLTNIGDATNVDIAVGFVNAGDLLVGTGANTGAILGIAGRAAGDYLRINAGVNGLEWSAGAGAVPALDAVLGVGNDGNGQGITNAGNIGCADIQAPFGGIVALNSTTIQDVGGTGLAIDPVGTLTLKGCQTKGTILVGDGASSVSLPSAGATDGFVLTKSAAAAEGMVWSANVASVSAGANIGIGGTPANQTISVLSPLTSQLNIGAQSIVGTIGFDSTTINANGIDNTYFQSGVSSSNADLIGNAGGAQLFLSGSNLAAPSAHSLTIETPTGGDAIIDHTTVSGTARNLAVSTQGNLTFTADNVDLSTAGRLVIPSLGSPDSFDYNPALGRLSMTTDNTGGALNPIMFLQNTNATGSVALEVYKNKPTAPAIGDTLFTQSVFGKDSVNGKQEYTRISHTIRDPTSGVEDGSIEMGCFVNGVYTNMIQLNGNDTPLGEVNILKPIDLSTGSDGLIKVSGSGSNNLTLDAQSSIGTGGVNVNAKTGADINLSTIGIGAINLNQGATIFKVGSTGVSYTGSGVSFNTNGNIALTTTGAGDTNIQSADKIILNSTTGGVDITAGGIGNLTLNSTSTGDVLINAEDQCNINGKQGLTLRTTLGAGADVNVVSTRDFNITTDNTVGKISLTGTKLQSNTAGGNSGEHLVITLNGVVYKIALLNP